MDKKSSAYRAGMLIVTVLILFLASSVIMSFIPGISDGGNLIKMYVVNTVLVSIISILLPTLLFMRRQSPERFHVKRARLSQNLLAIVMGVGVFLIAAGINTVFDRLFTLTGADTTILSTPIPEMNGWAEFLICLLVIAIIPAVSEELLFRGALLHSWRGLGRVRAAALTAILFALVHMALPSLPALFAIGFILGLAAYDANSVWPSVIIHFLNNGLSLVFSLFASGNTQTGAEPAWLTWALAGACLVIGMLIFVPAYIGFRKFSKGKQKLHENTPDSAASAPCKPSMPTAHIAIVISVMGSITLISSLAMYLHLLGLGIF